MSMPAPPEASHYSMVAQAILSGHVVPVLGAGANLCDREKDAPWEHGKNLPNGAELAEVLAQGLPSKIDDPANLLRVSQASALALGYGPMFEKLRRVFAQEEGNDYEPTSLHDFLAGLPQLRARRNLPARPQLIVTTNYDDLLERAFDKKNEPYDLVYYLAQGEGDDEAERRRSQGKFMHVDPTGERHLVRTPKKYVGVSPQIRTVILKIHGAVREDPLEDSWVITEDHYIDYLTRTNLSELVPVKLLQKLLASNFLFLGYAMQDWNLRVMLHRIWTQRSNDWKSWAVQIAVDELDTKLWAEKGVTVQCASLKTYLTEVAACLETVQSDF